MSAPVATRATVAEARGVVAKLQGPFGASFTKVALRADHALDRTPIAAVTRGEEIVAAPRSLRPGTARTRLLVAHELAHVLHHRGGAPGSREQAESAARKAAARAARGDPAGLFPTPWPRVERAVHFEGEPAAEAQADANATPGAARTYAGLMGDSLRSYWGNSWLGQVTSAWRSGQSPGTQARGWLQRHRDGVGRASSTRASALAGLTALRTGQARPDRSRTSIGTLTDRVVARRARAADHEATRTAARTDEQRAAAFARQQAREARQERMNQHRERQRAEGAPGGPEAIRRHQEARMRLLAERVDRSHGPRDAIRLRSVAANRNRILLPLRPSERYLRQRRANR